MFYLPRKTSNRTFQFNGLILVLVPHQKWCWEGWFAYISTPQIFFAWPLSRLESMHLSLIVQVFTIALENNPQDSTSQDGNMTSKHFNHLKRLFQ